MTEHFCPFVDMYPRLRRHISGGAEVRQRLPLARPEDLRARERLHLLRRRADHQGNVPKLTILLKYGAEQTDAQILKTDKVFHIAT